MASSHAERWQGGPSFWPGRVARGLATPPGRQVRAHGPHGRGRGGHPQGDTGTPPPMLGLEWTALALDGWGGRPSHTVSLVNAKPFLQFSPLKSRKAVIDCNLRRGEMGAPWRRRGSGERWRSGQRRCRRRSDDRRGHLCVCRRRLTQPETGSKYADRPPRGPAYAVGELARGGRATFPPGFGWGRHPGSRRRPQKQTVITSLTSHLFLSHGGKTNDALKGVRACCRNLERAHVDVRLCR
jgi:hypothetical protein